MLEMEVEHLPTRTDDNELGENVKAVLKLITSFWGTSDSQWLAEIFAAMITHLDNGQVQQAACRSLWNRISVNPSLCILIGEESDHLLPLHSSVLAALSIHIKDVYVFQAACCAIYEMAIHSKNLQQYLVAKGAYVTIIEEMRESPDDIEIHSWGYHVLRALSFQNPHQEELMFTYDIQSDIEKDLMLFCDEIVLKECIGLLVCLATDLEIVKRQCVNLRIPEQILTIMTQNVTSEDLVLMSLEAIAVFSTSEEELLLRVECIRDIRHVMANNQSNSRIQQTGCIIMQLMAAHQQFVTYSSVCTEILLTIQEAMSRFEDDLSVQSEGCVALYLMFGHKGELCQEIKSVAIEMKIHDLLFSIIEYFRIDDEVTILAQQCLFELTTKQLCKDVVLQRACFLDYLKCAEYMISLGADVDAGIPNYSPLCIAALNGNIKLLELLLKHDASEAPVALSLSLEENRFDIAGVLLRHIGYEKESGLISWSNMNIKELNPELLFATLTHASSDDIKFQSETVLTTLRKFEFRRSKASSFNESPRRSINADESSLRSSQNRWHSDTDLQEEVSSDPHGKRTKSFSGAILPYNTLDLRLARRNSQDRHVIVTSSTEEWFYPGHPDAEVFSDPNKEIGIFLSPQDKSITPELFVRTKTPIRRCLTDDLTVCKKSRCISLSHLNPNDFGKPSKIKRNSPARQRTVSCLARFQEKTEVAIKLLDISHNHISDLNDLMDSPTAHIIDFLGSIENLDLSNNVLTDLPGSLCSSLPHLKALHAANNGLSKLPYKLLTNQKLQLLDISNNKISDIDSSLVPVTLSLLTLDLSKNNLREFPSWVYDSFPRLHRLFLSHNEIREIPATAHGLRSLKELSMRYNYLTKITEAFINQCTALEKIDFSHNQLFTLPNYTPNTLSRLSHIRLSNNKLEEKKPFYIPRILLSVPSLQFLDISYNRITQLPELQYWSSRELRELVFSNNRICKMNLNKTVGKIWPKLSRLDLSHNKLDFLPSHIGYITTLCSLDVSHNPISVLPDEIGRLTNLFDFPLDGLRLQHEPAVLKGTPQDVVSFFGSKLKQAVPYRRIKLMLVGLAGRGKTSLMRQLKTMRHPKTDVATVGIEVNDWNLKPPRQKMGKKYPSFVVDTWDFAGQEDFYSTHQYFLSPRALYLAVYDVSRGIEEINTLTPWLLNIQAAAPQSLVILVGTHADKVAKDHADTYFKIIIEHISKYLKGPGFPVIRAQAIVNCMRENLGIESLREQIYEIISNFTYRGQPIIEQMVPKSYVELQDLIKLQAKQMSSLNKLPIVSKKRLWQITVDSGVQMDQDEFARATKFLSETGCLLHFSDPTFDLNNLFFLDPQWLCQMMARVVTVKEINPFISPQGILSKADSVKLFQGENYSKVFISQYFRLLRKFEVVLPISDEKYLVTPKLPKTPPQHLSTIQQDFLIGVNVICRRYVFPYIPSGFWARLITRMLLFADIPLLSEHVLQYQYWQNGMYVKWSNSKFFLVAAVPGQQNSFDVFAPINRCGYKLLGKLADMIDALVEEWYPGLAEGSVEGRGDMIQRLASCDSCVGLDDPYFFNMNECIASSYDSDTVECPNCGPRLIHSVAPDAVFADLDPELIIKECEIQFQGSQRNALGSGAFATVYKAKVDGNNLAVKVFGDSSGSCPNRLLRQEVDILNRLNHPCLISLVGVSLRPRMLLLEYAPLGNLQTTLTSRRGLSRGMQHRIAVQISEGLAYIHYNNIVYRDLKPENILVFSLSMGVLINVKISDYGISQWVTPLGLNARKGTPGFQAPEVAHGYNEYSTEVDIFSFGVTLYKIVTGHMPYGNVPFQNELDAAVLSNKPINSIASHGCSPWPDVESLIGQCLLANPAKRPTAAAVCESLLSVELLCLKRETTICKDQSVECLTVRNFIENNEVKTEVWVGSGEVGSPSQLSWFTLNHEKKNSVQGMLVKEGRILCMATCDNYIIVGTKKGLIIVYDGALKERSHCLEQLDDSVLCIKLVTSSDILVAGLANGNLAVYKASHLVLRDTPARIVTLNSNSDLYLSFLPPIACMTICRNLLICGFGPYALEVRFGDFSIARKWKVSEKNQNISCIVVEKNHFYVACKESSVITVLDLSSSSTPPTDIDCFEILQNFNKKATVMRDSRVVSMCIERGVLWIGTGAGHIVLVDTVTRRPSSILSRYTSAVRSIIAARSASGKPASVITGGLCSRQLQNNVENYGYVLVWEADLAKQQKHLECERRKREELVQQMCNND